MMLEPPTCVSSGTACTNILQSFETFVKMRISMQFEIYIFWVMFGDID